jgi:2-polyprenyl-6-methoxyphenol hydroxylase-like FAD-dependent oxidoreductase
LAGYDEDRRERTQKMVRVSALRGRMMNGRSRFAAWLRDLTIWALPEAAFMRSADDAFGWQPPARR